MGLSEAASLATSITMVDTWKSHSDNNHIKGHLQKLNKHQENLRLGTTDSGIFTEMLINVHCQWFWEARCKQSLSVGSVVRCPLLVLGHPCLQRGSRLACMSSPANLSGFHSAAFRLEPPQQQQRQQHDSENCNLPWSTSEGHTFVSWGRREQMELTAEAPIAIALRGKADVKSEMKQNTHFCCPSGKNRWDYTWFHQTNQWAAGVRVAMEMF